MKKKTKQNEEKLYYTENEVIAMLKRLDNTIQEAIRKIQKCNIESERKRKEK